MEQKNKRIIYGLAIIAILGFSIKTVKTMQGHAIPDFATAGTKPLIKFIDANIDLQPAPRNVGGINLNLPDLTVLENLLNAINNAPNLKTGAARRNEWAKKLGINFGVDGTRKYTPAEIQTLVDAMQALEDHLNTPGVINLDQQGNASFATPDKAQDAQKLLADIMQAGGIQSDAYNQIFAATNDVFLQSNNAVIRMGPQAQQIQQLRGQLAAVQQQAAQQIQQLQAQQQQAAQQQQQQIDQLRAQLAAAAQAAAPTAAAGQAAAGQAAAGQAAAGQAAAGQAARNRSNAAPTAAAKRKSEEDAAAQLAAQQQAARNRSNAAGAQITRSEV